MAIKNGTENDDFLEGTSDNDRLSGLGGDDSIRGYFGEDILDGGDGDDMLYGGAGIDRMFGGAGNDGYVVDQAGDQATEADRVGGGGMDRVYASVSYALDPGSFIEILSTVNAASTDAINLFGNEYSNTLIGNEGDNRLDGRGGVDRHFGLGGNDVYVVDDALDRVFEEAGDGADRVYAGVDYELEEGVSVETLSTLSATTLTPLRLAGNALDNDVIGNAGANVLVGNQGEDLLSALGGDDSLAGGDGNDRLFGGAGADRFYFNTELDAGNVDDILDFAPADDSIYLNRAVFAGIGPEGELAAERFETGSAAADGSDRIVYNRETGEIFFDSDGSGAAEAVLFARVDPGLALTHADFVAYG